VKAVLAISGLGGADKSITLHTVLAVAWAVGALCRNADHWYHSPEKLGHPHDGATNSEYRTVASLPKRRKMWPWLFPFFNLAFVSALLHSQSSYCILRCETDCKSSYGSCYLCVRGYLQLLKSLQLHCTVDHQPAIIVQVLTYISCNSSFCGALFFIRTHCYR
jgi:hypothetical protein